MRGLDRWLTLTDIVYDSQFHQPVWDLQEVLTERSETVQKVPTRQLIGDRGQDQGWREFPDQPNGAWLLLRRLREPHWIDDHPLPVHELSSPLGSVYEVSPLNGARGTHDLVVYEALDLPFVPIEVCGRYRVRETTRLREREGRGAATIYDFLQERGLVTVNRGQGDRPGKPSPMAGVTARACCKDLPCVLAGTSKLDAAVGTHCGRLRLRVGFASRMWISAATTCSSLQRLIAERSIHLSRSRRPHGHQQASWIGG
jgi:hypothetical protein